MPKPKALKLARSIVQSSSPHKKIFSPNKDRNSIKSDCGFAFFVLQYITLTILQEGNFMWYKILVENEFADYLINCADSPQNADDEQKTEQMLKEYSDLVYGVVIAWAFYDSPKIDKIAEGLAKMSPLAVYSFDFCLNHIPLTKTKNLGAVFHSIPRDSDLESLSAEQCASSLIYPFLSRMGQPSFEKEFLMSGGLKEHLVVLKSKCARA